ncbi:DUF4906 domain-containing protein [uncultured Muribaculum sp.]|uniref:DUF4906 domain-containing protein n=1 Tax=uncultured Muribaculum sp. TaxID=1918613 RepID=UPI0026E28853|nr:DUF4906 domain-containing protein [uncultured Muribaculum sp.]
MKLFSHIAMFAAGMLALASCSDESIVEIDVDDPFVQPGDRAATIEVPLRFHVEKPSLIGKPLVNDIPSRAEGKGDDTTDDPEKAAEEAINDIWVFQYDENGNQLIAPRFYKVESSEIRKLNIRLAEGNDSHVYVLANTGDETWAQDKDFSTVEKFVSYEYPFTEDNVEMGEDERLLMEGHVESTIRKETDLHPIDIHLTRMMAKISFKYVTAEDAKSLIVTRVIINNMPLAMRMEETPKEENYPTGNDFETRSVTLDKKLASGEVYTFYMPANRRGTTTNTDPKAKNNGAPEKALYVQLFVTSRSNGSNFLYTIYLGENDTNDFNVRRNHNYNITLNLKSEIRDDRVLAAAANCFVVNPNNEIMFDPYTRTETGGGWKYSDYVNKKVPAKKIAYVKILWQYVNVIGDNSKGDRVWLDQYDRVHVKTGTAVGNAVIAAYNSSNKILWSWHIWVNNDKPANLDEAVPYYTFGWTGSADGKTGSIITTNDKRSVKGRSLMKCNLGAKSGNANDYGLKTYGTVYQWGRKDPFPIGNLDYNVDYYQYSRGNVGDLRDNNNATIAMNTTGAVHTTELFSTEQASATTGTIAYAIEHPTHFISPVKSGASNPSDASTCNNDGDWFWGHNDLLWGGKPYSNAKKYEVTTGCVLSDNGATEKSIFDPCPAGWMVPPGDMWLGFTKNGRNATGGVYGNINSVHTSDNASYRGFRMYVQEWKKGKWVYFPSQGLRTAGGRPWRNGMCGNYHTSSASAGGRVNIFHLHTPGEVDPFETSFGYSRRAVGGPVRCVRDVDESE